jgi:hypothetical protein
MSYGYCMKRPSQSVFHNIRLTEVKTLQDFGYITWIQQERKKMTQSNSVGRTVLQGAINSAILKTLIIFGRGSAAPFRELRALTVPVSARTDTELKQ